MKFCQRTTLAPKASACDTVGLFETAPGAEASGQDAGLPASFVTFLSGKEKFEKTVGEKLGGDKMLLGN